MTNFISSFCSLQCLMIKATEIYMNKSALPREIRGTKYCAQSEHVPCWIPQIKDVIDPDISSSLEKCPTVWDYVCELQFLLYIHNFGSTLCLKTCKTWHYKFYEGGKAKFSLKDKRVNSRYMKNNMSYKTNIR